MHLPTRQDGIENRDKVYLISSFRHHDIRAKTRPRMTTATTFSCQNDAGSRLYTTSPTT